jgi:cold shock CspA family protein
MTKILSGTVKWFNKQYGFIIRDDCEADVFIHKDEVYAPG